MTLVTRNRRDSEGQRYYAKSVSLKPRSAVCLSSTLSFGGIPEETGEQRAFLSPAH